MQHDETPSEVKYYGLPSLVESQDDVGALDSNILEQHGSK